MSIVRDAWHDLHDLSPLVTGAVLVVGTFVVAIIVERVLVRFLRRSYIERIDRAAAAATGVEELSRTKRQKTFVTLLESLVRYGVYGAAIVVALGFVTDGRTGAVFGASLVVLVGFGFQRLLGDVIAGALILFEGHFAVGDVITVHTHNVTGMVEEFSLRTTVLRTLAGDRITVLNGAMISFTRWSFGQREFRVELLVRADEAGERAVRVCTREAGAAGGLWVREPMVAIAEEQGDGTTRIIVTVVVAPSHEVMAERLGRLLAAEFGEDAVVGGVDVLNLYAPAYGAYRTNLLVR